MRYLFDAIKIEEKILADKTEEVSCMYIVKMDYNSLIEMCGVGDISINRTVDENRAKKMVKYIRERNSFYPPIIVATTKKNLIVYDEMKNKIIINKEKLIENKDMLVIDGQHRYTSIELLGKENAELIKGRYQSIFLIDNLNEFQQRKIFIDINNTAKKVSTGTKLRLDKTLINYISLMLVDNSIIVQQKISMDGNQTSSMDKIPYKFIIRGNEKLFKIVDDDYDKDKIDLERIDSILPYLYKIWNNIFSIIEVAKEKECKIVTNEVFYEALGSIFESLFIDKVYLNIREEISVNEDEFSTEIKRYIDNINNNLQDIDRDYYSKPINSSKERYDKIIELINNAIRGENNA